MHALSPTQQEVTHPSARRLHCTNLETAEHAASVPISHWHDVVRNLQLNDRQKLRIISARKRYLVQSEALLKVGSDVGTPSSHSHQWMAS